MKVDGNEYHKDTAFVSSICEDSPQLGKIVNIYIINKNIVVFRAHEYMSTYYPHFHAYILTNSGISLSYFYYKQLVSQKPVHIRQPQSMPHHNVVVLPFYIK